MSEYTFEECVRFHRMRSLGLASGYVLANYAMKLIGAKREDSLFCVTECQNCITNAAMMVTGCTTGRGDLVVKDSGKYALSLVKADTGEGVRVIIDNFFLSAPTDDELVDLILATPAEKQCSFRPVRLKVPQRQPMQMTVCPVCGERFLKRYAVQKDGRPVCHDCAEV